MVLSYWDAVVTPFYIIALIFFANAIRSRNETEMPEYRFFPWGLYAKIVGAIAVCLIYTFYYDGGDTVNYFTSTQAFANLLEKDPSSFIRVMIEKPSPENFTCFDQNTGFPLYWWDARSTMVSKLLVPIYYLGAKSYIASSIVLA